MRSNTLHLVALAVLAIAPVGCATDGGGGGEPVVTGKWSGMFTTDSDLARNGTFMFDFSEDASTHAVTATFSGNAAGNMLGGTFSGTHANGKLDGTVKVTAPISMSLAFPDATVDATQITGSFKIDTPVAANGTFTLDKQ